MIFLGNQSYTPVLESVGRLKISLLDRSADLINLTSLHRPVCSSRDWLWPVISMGAKPHKLHAEHVPPTAGRNRTLRACKALYLVIPYRYSTSNWVLPAIRPGMLQSQSGLGPTCRSQLRPCLVTFTIHQAWTTTCIERNSTVSCAQSKLTPHRTHQLRSGQRLDSKVPLGPTSCHSTHAIA